MDWDIKEFGSTLAIGAYLLVSVRFLAGILLDPARVGAIRWPGFLHDAGDALKTVILLTASFGVGMIAEDLSNKFVDTGSNWFVLLPGEDNIRTEVLLGEPCQGKIAPLGADAADRGLLARYGGPSGDATEQFILTGNTTALCRTFHGPAHRAANALYYQSKNRVFDEDTYFAELTKVQTRIDFARSLALLTAALAFVLVVGAAVRIARRRSSPPPYERMLLAFGVLALVFLTSRYAYAREEREFDLRAYGYYLSSQDPPTRGDTTAMAAGISGLAPAGPGRYLVVHDAKGPSVAARTGLALLDGGGIRYASITERWPEGAPASDLESACSLPDSESRFLLAESDFAHGAGHLFSASLAWQHERWTLELEKIPVGPSSAFSAKDSTGVEGMVCTRRKDGMTLVIFCERGSRDGSRPAALRWGTLRQGRFELALGSLVIPIQRGVNDGFDRVCSDLHLDTEGVLWTAATSDGGDTGPFRSVVYALGSVNANATTPVGVTVPSVAWRLEGSKVEAIGAFPFHEGEPGRGGLLVGTDDERLGGVLRALPPRVETGTSAGP